MQPLPQGTAHSDPHLLPAPLVSASTPTPTTLVPSLISKSEGSDKAVSTQSSPGEQPHPRTPVCPSLRCHLQAALEDVSVESLSHTLSQEGGALNSGAPTVGQARAGHCQMPPQAPVWPSAPRERVRCPDHTGRCMVRGRPTGQLWTPMVQPTLGKSVELRPSQKLCHLPAALPATCTWLQLL